jgi:radical SAM superfamily enzyme YgiQ (UPF0313 family)
VPHIVLTTLNAKYAHAAFGLRYLMANLGDLRDRAAILEFDISQRPVDVLEAILTQDPRIVGVGVYIWNASQSLQLVADLKRVRPDITVVLGGPEVSYEVEQQEICRLADYVITGEADLTFGDLCRQLLAGRRPLMGVIPAELPEFDARRGATSATSGAASTARMLALPYDLYTDEDIAHRVLYVEASRGCPFRCEFCLSSLDVPVRNVPLDAFLGAMRRLLDRGARQFKFVDRTFNLNLNVSRAILEFFRERYTPGMFLHFEMIPDRLPEALRAAIRAFPAGALQFEVGVQSLNDDVCARISRRQDVARLADNLRFLRDETGVHVHADLIVGLPGEDLASFGRGFDRLVAMRPQEIQVGVLKRLRGTPIVRHDAEWGMAYSASPPYEVLRTNHVGFADMQRMRRFARYWELIANSGNFVRTTPLIWRADAQGEGAAAQRVSAGPERAAAAAAAAADADSASSSSSSPFVSFLRLSDWLFARVGRHHAIALPRLAELLFQYLTSEAGRDVPEVAAALWTDYRQGGRRDGPDFLRPYVTDDELRASRRTLPAPAGLPPRQSRHRDVAAAPTATAAAAAGDRHPVEEVSSEAGSPTSNRRELIDVRRAAR